MFRFCIFVFVAFFSANLFAQSRQILIIGDSLTEGHDLPNEDSYPSQLQVLINNHQSQKKKSDPPWVVVNAGNSGWTSASGLSQLKKHLAKQKIEILILALGANDALRGFDLTSTKKNLAAAVDLAKKNKIKVLLAGMKAPPNYGAVYVTQFEEVFKSLAREKKVRLIPFLLEGVAGEKNLNLADGIHPNARGYQIVAQNVFRVLKEDL